MAMLNDPASVSVVGAWSMNVVSSVGIIMVNKQVMSGCDFGFATTLTALHLATTGAAGALWQRLGYLSEGKGVPFWEVFWFAQVACVSLVSMNLSLMLNSVGFYQIAKLSIMPAVCVLEWALHGQRYSRKVKGTVVLVMLGVGICTVTDVRLNVPGFIAAVVAVISTAVQQIYIGELQRRHGVGSFDLLRQTAPVQAATLLPLGPFLDYLLSSRNILLYSYTLAAVVFISLSCVLAVVCNLSQYLCIGKFSATTFQVLGHMKTVLVLLLGWVVFHDPFTLKNFTGMMLAVAGMLLYSWATERHKAVAALKGANSKEGEVQVVCVPEKGEREGAEGDEATEKGNEELAALLGVPRSSS